MAFKRYIVTFIFEHWQIRNDHVVARSETEAKRKVRKYHGKKATDIKAAEG